MALGYLFAHSGQRISYIISPLACVCVCVYNASWCALDAPLSCSSILSSLSRRVSRVRLSKWTRPIRRLFLKDVSTSQDVNIVVRPLCTYLFDLFSTSIVLFLRFAFRSSLFGSTKRDRWTTGTHRFFDLVGTAPPVRMGHGPHSRRCGEGFGRIIYHLQVHECKAYLTFFVWYNRAVRKCQKRDIPTGCWTK